VKRFGFVVILALASLGLAQECEEGFRLFTHEMMENEPTCIPENPQRIVALNMAAAEVTLYTNKTLLASSPWVMSEVPVMLPDLAETYENAENVGYPANLESVLQLRPDLILTAADYIDVAAASEIAPVIVARGAVYEDWKDGLDLWSAALGAPELYTTLTASYDERVVELQNLLGEQRSATEVSLLSVSSNVTWLWLVETAPGSILSDVGLSRPESQNLSGEAATERYADAPYVSIAEERLDLADGDVIFAITNARTDAEQPTAEMLEENAAIEAFQQNPLWQGLSGVQSGNAHFVGGHWWRAQTYLLVNKVLDDMFEYLAGEPGSVPTLSFEEIAR
jgi:iron complex transport system substrate-binding protein